jgi:hypothetical protein
MKLSEYEERVLTELEEQFQPWEPPAPRWPPRLVASVVCFLAGATLLVATHHAALAISLSNSYGYSPLSIASGFALTGHVMLLASAFLLGRAWDELRQRRSEKVQRP